MHEPITVQDYRKIAKKVINHYCKKSVLAQKLLRSEESIGNIAGRIMKADHTYKPGTHLNKRSWRGRCARWALLKEIKQLKPPKKIKIISLDTLSADTLQSPDDISPTENFSSGEKIRKARRQVQYLLENSGLTPIQNKCVRMYYLGEMTYLEIGQSLGISKQAVQQNVAKALRAMKFIGGKND